MGSDMQWYGEMVAAEERRQTQAAAVDILQRLRRTCPKNSWKTGLSASTLKWVKEYDARVNQDRQYRADKEKKKRLAKKAKSKLSKAERDALGVE